MEEEDGGESSNAQYYGHLWNKQWKLRVSAKRLKPKRVSKATPRLRQELILLGDMSVGAVKHLLRLHHKRIHTRKRPLLR